MSATNARCLQCDADMRDAGYLCWACCATLANALVAIADAWSGIDHATSGWGRRRPQTGRVHGLGGDGMPVGAMDARIAAVNALTGYERLMDEEGRWPDMPVSVAVRHADATTGPVGTGSTPGPVEALCERLADGIAGIRTAPWAPAAYDELVAVARQVERVVQPPEDPPQRERRIVENEVLAVWCSTTRAAEVVRLLRHPAPHTVTVQAWAGQTGRPPILDVQQNRVRIGQVLAEVDRRAAARKGARRAVTSGNTPVAFEGREVV